MTSAEEGWGLGKPNQFRRLALGGLGLKEIVHSLVFDGGTWQEEFVRDLDRWMKNGCTEALGYAADARIMPGAV